MKKPRRKARVEDGYRITAYLPTHPPHHPKFKSYQNTRLYIEDEFAKLFGGATTIESDGVYLYHDKERDRVITDKTLVVYAYARIDEQTAKETVTTLLRVLGRRLPKEQSILITYQKVGQGLYKKQDDS